MASVGFPMNRTTLKGDIKLTLTQIGYHLVPQCPASLPICKNAPPFPVRLAEATHTVPCEMKLSPPGGSRLLSRDGLHSALLSPRASCPRAWPNPHNPIWSPEPAADLLRTAHATGPLFPTACIPSHQLEQPVGFILASVLLITCKILGNYSTTIDLRFPRL